MRKKISREQQEAKTSSMMKWALYEGLLENVKFMYSDSTVLNIPFTIHYNDDTKKTIYWNDVKPKLGELHV